MGNKIGEGILGEKKADFGNLQGYAGIECRVRWHSYPAYRRTREWQAFNKDRERKLFERDFRR